MQSALLLVLEVLDDLLRVLRAGGRASQVSSQCLQWHRDGH